MEVVEVVVRGYEGVVGGTGVEGCMWAAGGWRGARGGVNELHKDLVANSEEEPMRGRCGDSMGEKWVKC